ncbi:hypothetical protein OQA88_3399 [Cercophora sp. LCS_1]
MPRSKKRKKMNYLVNRPWKMMEEYKNCFHPNGLPSHIDLNHTWRELSRIGDTTTYDRNILWKQFQPVCRKMLRWADMATKGNHATWKDMVNANPSAKIPGFGSSAIVMAICILGSCEPGSNGGIPSDFREAFHQMNLAWIIERKQTRVVPPFWTGADFDDEAGAMAQYMEE